MQLLHLMTLCIKYTIQQRVEDEKEGGERVNEEKKSFPFKNRSN